MIVIEVTDLNVVSIYLSVGSKARALVSTFYFPAIVTADLRDTFGVTYCPSGKDAVEFTLASTREA